jgi:hypothetical protein
MGAYPTINLNDSTPSSTSGYTNVTWQSSTSVHSPNIANVTAQVPNLKASGTGHQGGLVPDPGAVAGTTKFLREDATWATPGAGGGLLYAADTGTVNAIVVAPAIPSLAAGTVIVVKVTNTNTSGATIAVDGAGAVALHRDGSALNANDVVAGQLYLMGYDGSVWNILGVMDATYIGGGKVKNGMAPSDGDLLTWVAANTEWENKAPGTLSGFNASKLQGNTISSGTPMTGDILRYNEYADSKWDLCIAATRFVALWGDIANASLVVVGANLGQSQTGTISNIAATSTETFLKRFTGVITASTNRTVGIGYGFSGGVSFWTLASIRRYSTRLRINTTSSARWWIGMVDFSTSGAAITSSDTPNGSYVAFRFSATTDATIKAVCATSNVNQTVVNTGISVDTTNPQLFEFAWDGTNVNFYINGALVAQISTNVPSSALLGLMTSGDNKNTNTVLTCDIDYVILAMK